MVRGASTVPMEDQGLDQGCPLVGNLMRPAAQRQRSGHHVNRATVAAAHYDPSPGVLGSRGDQDDRTPPVLPREPADELCFSPSVSRVRIEANELHSRRRRRTWPAIPVLALRNDKHRRAVLPGKLQRYGQSIAGTGQHHDRADMRRHSLGRPDEQPRADQDERHHQGHRCGERTSTAGRTAAVVGPTATH